MGLLALFAFPAAGTDAPLARPRPPAIVFEGGSPGDIWSVRADGTDLRRLTRTEEVERHPQWSPDRRLIAFGRYPEPFENYVELWVMERDGSDKELLTDRLYADPWFDWSPDGSQIVFAGRDPLAADSDLFVVDVADHSVKRLGGTDGSDYQPAWSPDGTSIAWTNGDVYKMAADGSGVTLLATEAARPTWSPDSQSIVFESWRNDTADPEYGPYTWQLFVVGRDGSDERRLTHAPQAKSGNPDWSPDGTRIAYVRSFDDDVRNGEPDVFVIDVASGEVTRVGTSRFYEGPPQWGPDGDYLVYPSNTNLFRKMPGSDRRVLLTPGPPRVGEILDL